MRVRKMDASYDMVFGGDQRAIWRDVPEAPAQVVLSRLVMFRGEWFLNTRDGTPWNTRVLGKYTGPTRDLVVRSRITKTPGVTDLVKYTSQTNRDTRKFSVQATIDTAYGRAKPINVPL